MIIQTFEKWRELRAEEIDSKRESNADYAMDTCEACDGDGELYSMGTWRECPFCEGEGVFDNRDEHLTRHEYQKACIRDIQKWCSWTRADFLQTVGHFIRAERIPEYRNPEITQQEAA